MKALFKTIPQYNRGQKGGDKSICLLLEKEIREALPEAESKIWHGSPVWFLEGNPIVGYHKLKDGIRLLFWSGQSFDEKELKKEGTFKAAEARFAELADIPIPSLRRWLSKSKKIQWDYKNIVKRKGVLERLK
ncbi:MAG: DUF1801 domain-containing protein [Spirochaetia bacterium]|nr:DUF1801 domain-containing protein [Spirochaetia bacterium]